MGLFNAFKKLLQSDENSASTKDEGIRCGELIRFITFAKKVKPLMGGNYGITISYSSPDSSKGEYTSSIYAEFGFYDFDNLRFAREQALNANRYAVSAQMVKYYYDLISKDAGLSQNDWPYAMDVYDFARMLTNSDEFGFTKLIPDESNDDIFTIKIKSGVSSRNGTRTYNYIEQECKHYFPNLVIKKHGVYNHGFLIHISI